LPAALRVPVFGALHSIWPKRSSLPAPLRLASIFRNLMVSDAEAFYLDLLMLDEKDLVSAFGSSWKHQSMGYSGFEAVQPLYLGNGARDSVGRAQYADMTFYMTDDVLVKVDRMSMANSLEVRSPLLDYRIIEFANSLPTKQKLGWKKGKLPLRALAEKSIPRDILDQPKRGFSIPVSGWLRGELREMAREMIFDPEGAMPGILDRTRLEAIWRAHQDGERDYGNFIWSLMMFRFWEREYLAGAARTGF
jgi:asparagine synthase (glutamine-hydrolysing)